METCIPSVSVSIPTSIEVGVKLTEAGRKSLLDYRNALHLPMDMHIEHSGGYDLFDLWELLYVFSHTSCTITECPFVDEKIEINPLGNDPHHITLTTKCGVVLTPEGEEAFQHYHERQFSVLPLHDFKRLHQFPRWQTPHSPGEDSTMPMLHFEFRILMCAFGEACSPEAMVERTVRPPFVNDSIYIMIME